MAEELSIAQVLWGNKEAAKVRALRNVRAQLKGMNPPIGAVVNAALDSILYDLLEIPRLARRWITAPSLKFLVTSSANKCDQRHLRCWDTEEVFSITSVSKDPKLLPLVTHEDRKVSVVSTISC